MEVPNWMYPTTYWLKGLTLLGETEIFLEVRDATGDESQWRWAIASSSNFCLPKEEDEWEYEPLLSSRTDEFLARTRYSFSEALMRIEKLKEKANGVGVSSGETVYEPSVGPDRKPVP